jgi:nitrile hydratase
MRPKGTRGWSEDELAAIVTRDSMIGTALPAAPKRSARRLGQAAAKTQHIA